MCFGFRAGFRGRMMAAPICGSKRAAVGLLFVLASLGIWLNGWNLRWWNHRATDAVVAELGRTKTLAEQILEMKPAQIQEKINVFKRECQKKYPVIEPPHLSPERDAVAQQIGDRFRSYQMSFADVVKEVAKQNFSIAERERLSFNHGMTTIYLAQEAAELRAEEVQAVLRAAPLPLDQLHHLNGVNVGAGGRSIPGTLPLDAHRAFQANWTLPQDQTNLQGTFLAWADELPFAPASLDLIVSLHNLEHMANPVHVVAHYLELLKPGGGVGVVIPNFHFAWDPRRDTSPWGHRWLTTPAGVCAMYEAFWKNAAFLEQLATINYSLSFDFVLRKHGRFVPFNDSGVPKAPAGSLLNKSGEILGFG